MRDLQNRMLTPVQDRVKLKLTFCVDRLKEEVDRLQSADWIDHFVTQNYDGDWSVIPLRGPASATHPVMMIYSDPNCTEFGDTPFLADSPYLQNVLSKFECPLQTVRLMKLAPGSKIKEHTDHDLAAELGMARLHIPVATNDSVEFLLNSSRVVMKEGECWYLRLSDPHSVHNLGNSDRVHLVIDVQVNGWFKEVLHEGQRSH